MDGRFFRSFAEAEMGVIQVNTSKNKNCTCKIWRFQGKPLPLQCYTLGGRYGCPLLFLSSSTLQY